MASKRRDFFVWFEVGDRAYDFWKSINCSDTHGASQPVKCHNTKWRVRAWRITKKEAA